MSPRGVPGYVRAMPRRAVSRCMGALVRLPVPRGVLTPLLRAYAWRYGANLAEAARPITSYATVLDFFVRPLKPGARPQDPDPEVVGSPADGKVHVTGLVAAGTTLQAKGVPYGVADLLGAEEDARDFEGGTATIVYLAPGDYHRFHWPFDGTVDVVRHLPGDLWPVHPGAVATVGGLFARNERVVCLGRLANGGRFAYVPVGALNVGSIRLTGLALRTNRGASARLGRSCRPGLTGRRGDEFGWFEMGSAIVLLLAPAAGVLAPLEPGTPVRVGSPIGRVRPSGRPGPGAAP